MDRRTTEESVVVYDEAGRVPEFVCVDYPGHVVSVDNMLHTLGGTDMISHVYSDPNRRLELRFRPSDAYCKPACATRASATGLLVRVTKRVKKKKMQKPPLATDPCSVSQTPEDSSSRNSEAVQSCSSEAFRSTLLGVVRTSYAFNTLCDFQYLPLVPVHDDNLPPGCEEGHPRPVSVSKISKDGASTRLLKRASSVSAPATEASASSADEKVSDLATSSEACKAATVPSEPSSDVQFPSSAELSSTAEQLSPTVEHLSFTEFSSGEVLSPTEVSSSVKLPLSSSATSNNTNDPTDLHQQTAAQSLPAPNEKSEEPSSEKGYAHPYECFAPRELVFSEWLRSGPQFLFLPPPAFTRMDTPQAYFFRGEESESSSRLLPVFTSPSTKPELSSSVSATSAPKSDKCSSSASATYPSDADSATGTSNSTEAESTVHLTDASVRPTPNVIYRTRQRRTLFAVLCDFDAPTPCEPHPEALSQLNLKFLQRSMSPVYQRLKQIFEERPIWSRAGIRSALGYSSDNIKYLLPTLGYYFTAGPWRNLWIKFSYDPRKKPESFVYQTFNYRLKQSGLIKSYIDAKRNYSSYLLPYKSNSVSRKKVSVIQSNLLSSSSFSSRGITGDNARKNSNLTRKPSSEFAVPTPPSGDGCKGAVVVDDNGDVNAAEEEEAERDDCDEGDYALLDPDGEESTFGDLDGAESTVGEGGESVVGDSEREGSSSVAEECLREENYIYRPGCIPPYRQMFYQYCDVLVPEIQQVLERCVLQTNERLRCDPRYGWLNRQVEDECRSIMGRVVDDAVRKRTAQEREQRSKATSAVSSASADTASL